MIKNKTLTRNSTTYQALMLIASPRHRAAFTKGYYYYLLKVAKEGILITNSLCVPVVNYAWQLKTAENIF